MRRLGSILASIAFVAALAVVVPSSAQAGAYPDVAPPVDTLPPTTEGWTTLTPEEAALRKLDIQSGTVKPWQEAGFKANGLLTKMSPIARANTVVLAGTAGFAIGASGIKMIMSSAGTWDSSMCTLPTLVRDAYTFATIGIGSSNCPQPVPTPNADQPVGYTTITAGGRSYQFKAYGITRPLGARDACYTVTGSLQAGYTAYMQSAPGVWNVGPPSNPGSQPQGCPTGSNSVAAVNHDNITAYAISPAVRIYGPGGVVAATMQETRADPLRSYRCEKFTSGTGVEAATSIVQHQDSQGIDLRGWTSTCDGITFDWDNPPDALRISELNPSTGTWTPVVNAPLSTDTKLEMSEYSECYDGSQDCLLTLQAVKGTETRKCFTATPGFCSSWWTDTQQATQPVTADGWEYQCKWGTYTVALSRCALYQHAFPATDTDTGVITDPTTGTPIQTSTVSTSPNTINPGVTVGTTTGKCMDTWFDDLNPIDWVMTPVKCALVWAFVPRQTAVDTALTTLTTTWAAKPPGQIAAAVESWNFDAGPAGCSISVEIFSGPFRNPLTPIDACPGSWVEPLTPISRLVVNVGMIVMVIVVLRRQIAGMVNYEAT